MTEFLNVSSTEPMGEDEGSPENEAGIYEWLVDNTDDLPLAERIELAESLGRDDIVSVLKNEG